MSLLDSLTSPKWQHSNPEVRKSAIAQLDDPAVLLELVKTDPDVTVQGAALSRISDPDTLDDLITSLPPVLQSLARAQRLQQLLPAPDRLDAISDDAVLVRIASLSDEPELMTSAIERIRSLEIRMDLACNHPVAQARLGAAQGITDINLLGELMQRSRGHDKGVYRHCKALVDEHHARQQAETQRHENILHLVEQARELSVAADTPDYETRYRALEQQWRLVVADAGQQEQFQNHLAVCTERLHHLAEARSAEEQAKAEREVASQLINGIIIELEQIDETATVPLERAAITQLNGVLDDIEERFQAAQKICKSSVQQALAYRKHTEHWRSLLATTQNLLARKPKLNKFLGAAEAVDTSDYQALQGLVERAENLAAAMSWPDSLHADKPAELTLLDQAGAQLQNQLSALEKDQPKYIARLKNLLDSARSELEQEHSKEADRALSKARRGLKPLAPKQRQHFEQEMKPAAARLHEVHEWLGFAIEPKKVDLCARMTALIGSTEDADMLAVKIQSLQDEWKQLGALAHTREQALWLEFKAAADEAWKPCKTAFAQRAKVHRKNLEARMQLVAQLVDYDEKMAWPGSVAEPGEGVPAPTGAAPDWKMVQKTLDAARAAFNAIKPVDQTGERKSQKAFRAICDRIYKHIKDEYERNINLKKQLVERARELAAAEDLLQSIELCKKLQREWKETGMTPVAVDRKLWKAFRTSCDAVFTRLDEQRVHNQAELTTQVKQAEALRDQARALLALQPDEQGVPPIKALAELKQQLVAITLPPAVQQRLNRDFQAMDKQARDLANVIRARQEQASWTGLLEKIKACALKTADPDTAAALWQTASELPKGIDAAELAEFWQHGPADDKDDQLRDACIALEVSGEIDSPAEDKATRMKYQMQRLVAGMGGRNAQPELTQLDHINAFISLRPSKQWAERFCTTLVKIRG